MAAACFVRERQCLRASRSLLFSISLISLALGSLAPRRAHARAAADTVFAGDWEHGGRFVLHLPPLSTPLVKLHVDNVGEYLLWQVTDTGAPKLRLALIGDDGRLAPGWPQEGMQPCSDTTGQMTPSLFSDGHSGVFVAWLDRRDSNRLYLQHVLPDAMPETGWPADGKLVLPEDHPNQFVATNDGTGGGYFGWSRGPGLGSSVFVTRVNSSGVVADGWAPRGFQVAAGDSSPPPRSQYTYRVRSIYAGHNGTCYLDYVLDFTCSGHGCYPTEYYPLMRVGDAGNLGEAQTSPSMYWRQVSPDGIGSVVSLFYWGGQYIVEHHPSSDIGGYWAFDVPGGVGELRSDGDARLLLISGNKITRYSYDGRRDSVWGAPNTNVLVSLPAGWGNHFLLSDGLDGMLCFWEDVRAAPSGGHVDIYANSFDAIGRVSPGWDESGLPLVTTQSIAVLVDAYRIANRQAVVLWTHADSTGLNLYAQRVSVDQPVPTQLAALSADATPDAVTLAWDAGASPTGSFALERSTGVSDAWQSLARLQPDGTGRIAYVDRGVAAGETYRYRLTSPEGRSLITEVAVPLHALFALEGAVTNPSMGSPLVRFSLASNAPAMLELIDLSGRRVRTREVGSLGAGRHEVVLGAAPAPGLYWLRLRQGAAQAVRRVVVVR